MVELLHYIRSDLSFSQRNDLDSEGLEVFFCDILLLKSKPIVIGTCSRPPKQSDFIEKLEESLFKIRSDSELYLLGDFNICLLRKTSNLCKTYLSTLRMFGLKQLITDATRVTASSSTLIDHILSNTSENICQFGAISLGLNDHCMVFATRKVVKRQIKLRSLKRYCKEEFVNQLSALNWQDVLSSSDVSKAWDLFKDLFHLVLDVVAPIKEIRLKQRTEPWMTTDILQNIQERDNWLNKFRKTRGNSYKVYCKVRMKFREKLGLSNQIIWQIKLTKIEITPKHFGSS